MAIENVDFWVKTSATVLQAAAIVVTAFFASRGLQTWRKQLVGKRRMEVAEDALTAFGQAMEALRRIRSPVFTVTESEAAARGFYMADGPGMLGFQDKLQRIHDYTAVWERLEKAQELSAYYLGDEVRAAIQSLRYSVWDVRKAVEECIVAGIPERGDDRKMRLHLERMEILNYQGEADALDRKITALMKQVETACVRHLH